MNAEHAKKIRGDTSALHHLCCVAIGDIEAGACKPCSQIFEGVVTSFGHPKPRISQDQRFPLRRATVDLRNPLGLGVGKWAKQDCIDYGEQARICADAKGQRKYSYKREDFVVRIDADRVTKISPKTCHHSPIVNNYGAKAPTENPAGSYHRQSVLSGRRNARFASVIFLFSWPLKTQFRRNFSRNSFLLPQQLNRSVGIERAGQLWFREESEEPRAGSAHVGG